MGVYWPAVKLIPVHKDHAVGSKLLPVFIAGAVAVFAAYEYYKAHPAAETQSVFQGYIEGEFTLLGAEQSGRIARLDVAEGDTVGQGAFLFSLDDTLAKARLAERSAALAASAARLRGLRQAQQRPEKIDVLLATQRRFKADLDLAVLELRRLEDLYRRKVASKEQFDQARTQFLKAKAARDEIRRQVILARLPARDSLIAAAEAEVKLAAAAKDQAQILLRKQSVRAPVAGDVQQLFFRAGEVIGAGQPVISLLPAGKLKALFFVPERQRAYLTIGARVQVSCDNCPGDLFARVSFISREAEFTPPVIFGPKERAKLVFRIEARLDPGTGKVSPGQPVSVKRAAAGRDTK